jgi:hypothetical protein
MKIYDKRVAFAISSWNLIAHGGVGIFAKTFFEMADELNWKVDIILDVPPKNNSLVDWLKARNTKFFIPHNPMKYDEHHNIYVFSSTLCNERIINFRNAFVQAMSEHVYDFVIANFLEEVDAIYNLGFSKNIPILLYTHHENTVGFSNDVFMEEYRTRYISQMQYPNMVVGTQSEVNVEFLKTSYNVSALALPMRVPERQLLESVDQERDGLLFIGRYEEGKNPEAFTKACEEIGAKPKVLTGKSSVKKWIAEFNRLGIVDYEIKAGVIGLEKVKFIQSARMAFHPSLRESFSFATFEELHSCPTYAFVEYGWYNNFKDLGINKVTKKDYIEVMKESYNQPWDQEFYLNQLSKLQEHDKNISSKWKAVLDNFKSRSTNRNKRIVDLLTDKCITLQDFYKLRDRPSLVGVDEYASVLNQRSYYKVIQVDDYTYVTSKTNNIVFPVESKKDDDDLFSF